MPTATPAKSDHAEDNDDDPEKPKKDAPKKRHAERNAICNAARAGTATENCTIYVEIMPCMVCARAIVQAGIRKVAISAERMALYTSAYYDEHFGLVEVLFQEAGVAVMRVQPAEKGAHDASV